jgi:hypothetical protein
MLDVDVDSKAVEAVELQFSCQYVFVYILQRTRMEEVLFWRPLCG